MEERRTSDSQTAPADGHAGGDDSLANGKNSVAIPPVGSSQVANASTSGDSTISISPVGSFIAANPSNGKTINADP